MSLSFAGEDISDGWSAGAPLPPIGDIIRDAMCKEKVIKEILQAQEDLRTLLARIKKIENENETLTSGNATLQTYIDNLTVQMVKRR